MNAGNPAARKLPAGRGVDWITEGYALFRRDTGTWLGIAMIWLLLVVLIPTQSALLGLALNLLTPVINGGLMLGCAARQRGEPMQVGHLWAGFTGELSGRLVMIAVYGLLGVFLVVLAATVVLGGLFGTALLSADGVQSLELGLSAVLAVLVALLVLTPVMMALWFAPALVAVHGMAPLPALKASFQGCLANVLPLTVNSLVMLVIGVIATIPFGLGWLAAIPVFTASIYFGYRDIFVAEATGVTAGVS